MAVVCIYLLLYFIPYVLRAAANTFYHIYYEEIVQTFDQTLEIFVPAMLIIKKATHIFVKAIKSIQTFDYSNFSAS